MCTHSFRYPTTYASNKLHGLDALVLAALGALNNACNKVVNAVLVQRANTVTIDYIVAQHSQAGAAQRTRRMSQQHAHTSK